MWRFKPFMPKEQTGLEGRSIDVGNIKVHVKNVIAEGGFSSVYLARDAINGSKQYALKHIICNDEESLDLVMKEISVMKSLRGHPNVVTLHSRAIFDMGRTKEAIIVMEFCEKSLVNVLESRGSGYFEEKQVLTIFRDVCNAVFAMHCQSPPIAHRDLKAENILLGADGLWKLCDFGSTSTNHKRFEKPEEMGIEEDNIRKHTTPAYRAPEMWDLFRKDLINEKVDIWALGCLLFRICYFKSAFDGESKLQILNGNYCIPDFPKYSSYVTDMIRDMLQPSPEARPDITQVWFRVNDLLPAGIQKSLPDRPPEMPQATPDIHEGISNATRRASMPRRSPPPPPSSSESTRNVSPPHASRSGGIESPLGAFWSTKHAKDSFVQENKSGSRLDEEMANHNSLKHNENSPEKLHFHGKTGALGKENVQTRPVQHIAPGESCSRPTGFFQEDLDCGNGKSKERNSESTPTLQEAAFNAFVADFDSSKLSSSVPPINEPRKGDSLEAEAERLREQLRQANLEKAEITSKYEKLSAVCRLQRQEIQELKQALASTSPSPENQSSVTSQQALLDKSSGNAESKAWQPFPDDPGPQVPLKYSTPHSVRTRNNHQMKQKNDQSNQGSGDGWGFGTDIFTAAPPGSSMISKSTAEGSVSQRFREPSSSPESKPASKPSGWAGF